MPNHSSKPPSSEEIGYWVKCSVCESPHKYEVEGWHLTGAGYKRISERLKRQYDVDISVAAISRHLKEHFKVSDEVVKRYDNAIAEYNGHGELFNAVVEQKLDDITMLERTVEENYKLASVTTNWLIELIENRKAPPMSLVQLRAHLQSEMRTAMKMRIELMGDDAQSRAMGIFESMWSGGAVVEKRTKVTTTSEMIRTRGADDVIDVEEVEVEDVDMSGHVADG